MTVIAYRDGVMAADKQTTSQGLRLTSTKIRKLPNGSLVGCSGNAGRAREMIAWLIDGADPKTYPDRDGKAIVLVVTPAREVMLYDETPYPIHLEDPFIAIGSGRDFALTAMLLGQPPREAVAIASRFDSGCGMGFDEITLD